MKQGATPEQDRLVRMGSPDHPRHTRLLKNSYLAKGCILLPEADDAVFHRSCIGI